MINEKLDRLRTLMKQFQLDAYLIPGTDEHQNEYLPERWKRREWLSGFTGSAGDVVVTMNQAGLWTDSRYYLQAEQQLAGSQIQLFKLGTPAIPDHWQWIKHNLNPGNTIGLDPRLINVKKAKQVKLQFQQVNLHLKFIDENLVDLIWENKPRFPAAMAFPYPLNYSGESTAGKIARLRAALVREQCQATIISKLDSIAWLFNIRGNDITYNPLVIAYAVVTESTALLFIDQRKVTKALQVHLADTVKIRGYTDFVQYLADSDLKQKKIWLDDNNTSAWIAHYLHATQLYFADCPVIHFKAVKNQTEIANFRHAHVRDGAAMVKFLHWLYTHVPKEKVTEAAAALKLQQFREENELYRESSFPTISAYKAHGAIVHYCHTAQSNSLLEPDGLFLIDSGAQYLDGTTDITRTISLGNPTAVQKEHFTRVLQGHLDLVLTSFPEGTQGIQLDTIARKPLWDIGLDYGHGTGHGIGAYLNVHEGPHAISQSKGVLVKLEEGMFCSIEPGCYRTGEYGIRIENVAYIERNREMGGAESVFFHFKIVTLCPVDLVLVEKSLLTNSQVRFLNEYHEQVRIQLSPLLTAEQRAWLEQSTRAV